MSFEAIMFYVLSAFVLGCGILSVSTRKIFRSAIYLLGALIGISGIYFLLEMEFIAAVQIVVYVGGIVVLIIFSIFLTQQSGRKMKETPRGRQIAALLAVLIGFILTSSIILEYGFNGKPYLFSTDVAMIGRQMLSTGPGGYALPFEVVSILLLASMIGCIVIALKSSPERK